MEETKQIKREEPVLVNPASLRNCGLNNNPNCSTTTISPSNNAPERSATDNDTIIEIMKARGYHLTRADESTHILSFVSLKDSLSSGLTVLVFPVQDMYCLCYSLFNSMIKITSDYMRDIKDDTLFSAMEDRMRDIITRVNDF